ncbi:Protein of unknown function DUF1810 [Fibrisoma limi BUZ 3]|uniref:Calpastatin n=1 Tax=Fibrisoma limi BUZ 3 TaxID=1185876 RepID=I2GIB4_9BACT|nr:DUF1810 domain-containing protein [Fibrisoma limi]CCH53639.1 Protein of unknown function DUF1810 [Fibrisoma limi BUZ 3]
MNTDDTLKRFLEAQANDYTTALAEMKNGRKQSHWIWYIFPQIAGLGFSEMAKYYSIRDLNEATAYLNHPVLGSRLIEITRTLLQIDGKTATQIMGTPDDLKLRSCMTLFSQVPGADPVFQAVIDKLFAGAPDRRTLDKLKIG